MSSVMSETEKLAFATAAAREELRQARQRRITLQGELNAANNEQAKAESRLDDARKALMDHLDAS